MIVVKMLNHEKQDSYAIQCREEGQRLFKDISKDGEIKDPVQVTKGGKFEADKDMQFSFILSDGGIDRDAERIRTTGWDLSEFLKNPVLLWSHDHSRPAIGTVQNLSMEGKEYGNLTGHANFIDDSKIDHFGWSIGQKVKMGIISAGSVGFFPTEYKFIDDPEDPAWLEFEKQTLWEFSICNIPSNPRALVENSLVIEPYKNLETVERKLTELTELIKANNNRVEAKTVTDLLGEVGSAFQTLHDPVR